MNMYARFWVLILICLMLFACNGNPTTATLTSPIQEPALVLTPTPTIAVVFPTQEPASLEQEKGEIEVRIPYNIFTPGETTPSEDVECVVYIPFRFVNVEMRTMIEGQAPIDCHFEDTPQGSPITFNVILEYECTVNGELLPATYEYPKGWLDTHMWIDGTIIQYYANYPDEATNPCPETDPCRTPITDNIPLPFAFEEGNTITTPWIFILHLQ